jgi:hypothetical protein
VPPGVVAAKQHRTRRYAIEGGFGLLRTEDPRHVVEHGLARGAARRRDPLKVERPGIVGRGEGWPTVRRKPRDEDRDNTLREPPPHRRAGSHEPEAWRNLWLSDVRAKLSRTAA